jgi:hypothetical protein
MPARTDKVVATGTWFYDQVAPMRIAICAKEAPFASSRYDEDDQLDETRSIPQTLDGFLYYTNLGSIGDHLTVDEAKAAADRQPWGPVKWD